MPAETTTRRVIPDATVARLPEYLRALTGFSRQGMDTVSSGELAAAAGAGPAQLRKDLSFLGAHGVRGVGYDVERLAGEIRRRLGAGRSWPVVVVGAGRLGQSLAGYPGLADGGFRVVALVDRDPAVVGTTIEGTAVRDVAELEDVVRDLDRVVGIVATSAHGAQDACDRLVDVGIDSILTFAPGPVTTPEHVQLRRVDVATELQILAFHAENGTASPESVGPAVIADGLVGAPGSVRPWEEIGS